MKHAAEDQARQEGETNLFQIDVARILDALPDTVIAANTSGEIVYVNAAAEALLGWSPDDLVGQPVAVVVPPRLRAVHTAAFQRYVRTGTPSLADHPLRVAALRRDRREVEVDLILATHRPPAWDGIVVGTLRTVDRTHHLEQSDERLRHQVSLTSAITESLGEGVYALDREGRVTFINPAAERMLGWTEGELLGQDMHEAIHYLRPDGTHVPRNDCPLLQVLQSGVIYRSDDDVFVRKDGTMFPVAYTSSPIWADNTILGTVLSFHDISAQRAVERQKDDFLSSMAHDLKTPLTTIKGVAQLLARRIARGQMPALESLQDSIGRIETTASRMNMLINELLDVTRLRMDRPLDLAIQSTDLVALANRVVTEQQTISDGHHITINPDPPEIVGQWDPGRIERVLTNLLSNAVKYSPENSHIDVDITLVAESGEPCAVVAVSDRGIGIPAEDLPFVWERFRRGTNAVTRVPGTGIGLATVRQIVERHGGSVAVQSQEGEGSTFTVSLPLAGPL